MIKYDKFDDVIWEKNVKTLITTSELEGFPSIINLITIETKGQNPETYGYLNHEIFMKKFGSRDSLINLVADVYGYEWGCNAYPNDSIIKAKNKVLAECEMKGYSDYNGLEQFTKWKESAIRLELLYMYSENIPIIVFRTISKYKSSFEYQTDLVWIKFKDGSRIVYRKD